jgi:hypothetical protein
VRESIANPEPAAPPLTIHPDLTVVLSAPNPVRIWSLTAFADQVRLQPQAEYRITNRSLKRALSAGFRVQDVETFLEKQSGTTLDSAARDQLHRWAETLGRVWLAPAMIVQAEQDEETSPLRSALAQEGLKVTPIGAALLVEGEVGMSAHSLEDKVTATLRDAGKSPQLRRSPEALASDERAGNIDRSG